LYEWAAAVVVAVLIWGIGTLGLGLVALERFIITTIGIHITAISTSGIKGICLLLTAPLLLGVMSYLLITWSQGFKGPAELIPLLKERSAAFPDSWVKATITWVIACIELGSGLSPKGFEGPYIAAAGGLSGWYATKVSLDAAARKRLARCGLGVAFGVLFHAPLGGLICIFEFAGFEWREFRKLAPLAFIATVASWLLTSSPLHLPDAIMPDFQIVSPDVTLSAPTILTLLLVGVSCGIAGRLYTLAIRASKRLFTNLQTRVHLVFVPVIGASLSTILGFFFPVIIGSNELFRAINQTQIFWRSPQGLWVPALLLGAILAKIMATAAADGSKCAGGTVGPAILLGGLIGRLVGETTNTIFAAAGSAAVIGPIAGLPLTMLVTAAEWCVASLGGTSFLNLPSLATLLLELALPFVIAKALCWRTELYPFP
jgi:H+/Cl- antiporter ClcA